MVWEGRFDAAEAAYGRLKASAVVDAQAHLATLLDYEGRYHEAVAQAQAAVAAHPDSDSEARLTRALDWSSDFAGALAAGAQAVAARPLDPLAPLFDSEALADAGYFAAAQRQIDAARGIQQDAFGRAELDRERANLDRDLGNSQSQLNWLELARAVQPAFPERVLELASYRYLLNQPTLGQADLASVVSAHQADSGVLLSAASTALVGDDLVSALGLYQAADKIRPGGAAALGVAELLIASKQDAAGARSGLEADLATNPGDAAARDLLAQLDQQVLKQDPAPDLPPTSGPDPAIAARQQLFQLLNQARTAAGLGTLVDDAGLDAAARAQAYYLLFNLGQVAGGAQIAEASQLTGYTAADPAARAKLFGYTGVSLGEVIGHTFSESGDVQGWLDSVYDRVQLLQPKAQSAGYARVEVGPFAITVLDLGGSAGTPQAAAWPPAGATGIPVAYVGGDSSDPLPVLAAIPAGYPVTLQSSADLSLSGAALLDPTGKEVAAYTLGPGGTLAAGQWALIPQHPLLPATTYGVALTGTLGGKPLAERWSFTTGRP